MAKKTTARKATAETVPEAGKTVYTWLAEKNRKSREYGPEFQRIFGVSLFKYWDIATGFDVIKFDEEVIKPGEDESSHNAVVRQWGERAVELIQLLIHI